MCCRSNGRSFSSSDFYRGDIRRNYGRWALVFGVLEGEEPEKYVLGTVLTEPIHWVIAETN